MKKQFRSLLPTAIALLTVTGIALHDSKLDSLTKIALAIPVFVVSYESANMLALAGLAGDAHTHVERVSVERTASKSTSWTPNLGSRKNQDKKYRLNNRVQKGHHAFDNYHLPVIA